MAAVPVEAMRRKSEAFNATVMSEGLREARLQAEGPLFAFLEGLRSHAWDYDQDRDASMTYSARLGLLSADDYLRDAVLCKILDPDLDAMAFREVATAGYGTLDVIERTLSHVYDEPGYDVREHVREYDARLFDDQRNPDMPMLLWTAVGQLPPDYQRGALEVASFVSWAQGDDQETVDEWCAKTFDVDKLDAMGSMVAALSLHNVRPAFMREFTRTEANDLDMGMEAAVASTPTMSGR